MFKRTLMKLLGIRPTVQTPDWDKRLIDKGYIILMRHGVFHWYHPVSGTQSGRYTTEAGARFAARLDCEVRYRRDFQ